MATYDCAIIGAGPAGLSAANQLDGYKTILIDCKSGAGLPLRCGEGIRKDGFVELFGRVDYPFIKATTRRMIVRCGSTYRALPIEFLILDRPAFEQSLARQQKGELLWNTRCEKITRIGNGKEKAVRILTTNGEVRARIAIIACGADYQLQKQAGLIKKSPKMVPCCGGICSHGDQKFHDAIYFEISQKRKTIAWIFPKGDVVNAGIGLMPGVKSNLRGAFASFCGRHNLRIKSEYAGSFPNDGPIQKTYSDNVMACGDAAGQVYPGSGEGIYFSLKSGAIAGQIAKFALEKRSYSSSVLSRYEYLWKASIGGQFEAGLVFLRLLSFGLKRNKLHRIIKIPTDKELVNLFMLGKVPIRARIADLAIRAIM